MASLLSDMILPENTSFILISRLTADGKLTTRIMPVTLSLLQFRRVSPSA
jgi:hypothetical protein